MTTPLPGLLWTSRPCHRLCPGPPAARPHLPAVVRSQKSNRSANRSPASNASIPTVPNVPTVQSMGPCLMSRESSPQHRRQRVLSVQPVPPVANASRPASRRPYPGRGAGVPPAPSLGSGPHPTPKRPPANVPPDCGAGVSRGRGAGVSPAPSLGPAAHKTLERPSANVPPDCDAGVSPGRGAGVPPTPTRRLIYPPQPSTPSVVWSSPCVCVGRLHAGALEGRRQRSPGQRPGKGPPHEHALEGHFNKSASKS